MMEDSFQVLTSPQGRRRENSENEKYYETMKMICIRVKNTFQIALILKSTKEIRRKITRKTLWVTKT